MKKLAAILVLLVLIAAAGAEAYSRLPLWQWYEGVGRWAEKNTGLVAVISGVLATAIGLATLLVTYLVGRRERHGTAGHDPERLALEHNYLLQLIELFEELQRQPLFPEEGEIVELQAELAVEPKFELVEVSSRQNPTGRGKFTSDLVNRLLKESKPVVVLGDPGAGKSVALRKVMLTLARAGLRQRRPRLPVYIRLGLFTRSVVGDESEAVEFARESLRALGNNARPIADSFDRYLLEGRFVFLLDAMDEMPREGIQQRFEALSSLRGYVQNKFLFACRKLDFPETFPFLRAYIQPFSRGQIRRFLRRSLDDLGAAAANAADEVLSPSNRLRDMAGNPFFLKLLSVFYRAERRLPDSRAELMCAYEGQVFERARARATFPRGLAPETLRAVMARLAYLITSSGRGVTFSAGDFMREFVPSEPSAGAARLAACASAVEEALDVLVRERLLHSESGAGGAAEPVGPAAVLSFHHHRLQEYYTAVYMEEFGAPLDWEGGLDNIWWQETLVMLFGITESPAERMGTLLGHVPARPLLCAEAGGAIGQLMYDLPSVGYVDFEKRERWRSLPPPLERLLAADPENVYGLKEVITAEGGPAGLAAALRERHVLPAGPDPTAKDVESLLELSPEPDENAFGEGVRRWLEGVNAVVLDRLELGVECYRNALGKLRDSETAEEARGRFVAALADFSKGGNMWETVRAIQIAARLPSIDLYSFVEPALFGKDAWCRNEAVAVVAKHPLSGNVSRFNVGFILFLQFMKGDLWNPLPFFRSAAESPRLRLKIPGVIILCVVSWLVLLSPFLTYFALRVYAGPWLASFGGGRLLGLGWPVWLTAFGLVVFPCAIYLAKHLWNVPILRTALLVCSLCVFVPLSAQIVERSDADLKKYEYADSDDSERMRGNAETIIRAAPSLGKVMAITAGMLVAPQVAEVAGLSVLALACWFLLWSTSIIRAPVIYVRNVGVFSTYLEWAQRKLLKGMGLISALLLLNVGMALLIRWSQVSADALVWIGLCIGGGVLLAALVVIGRSGETYKLRELPVALMEIFLEDVLGERPARRVGLGLLAAALAGLLLWGLYVVSAALAGRDYLGTVLLSLIVIVIVSLTLKYTHTKGLLVFFYYRLFGRAHSSAAAAPAPGGREDEADVFRRVEREAGAALTAEERFTRWRDALGRVKSPIFRRMVYDAMAKAYKEMRQKRRGGVE
jgi:hypothetical protein